MSLLLIPLKQNHDENGHTKARDKSSSFPERDDIRGIRFYVGWQVTTGQIDPPPFAAAYPLRSYQQPTRGRG